MKEFFLANGTAGHLYKTYYDKNKVRFEAVDGEGVLEFSIDDPSLILHSHLVDSKEIDLLSIFMQDNLHIMQAQLQGKWIDVPENMDKLFQTPKWLSLPWINQSQICQMLYGKKDKSTTAYFALKRQGKRPWKQEELERLESIRRHMIHQVQEA